VSTNHKTDTNANNNSSDNTNNHGNQPQNTNSKYNNINPTTAEILKTAVDASDPDALTKLLEHIESLQSHNAEMTDTLESIQKKNMENYHVEVQQKIEPWVKDLNIPPEQKASFLRGIQVACEQGMKKKGMLDFQSNPAFSVACAAAEAHGTAIQSAETFRLQLLDANTKNEQIKTEQSNMQNSTRTRQNAIMGLTSALQEDSHGQNSNKCKVEDVYNNPVIYDEDAPDTECWKAVFSKMSEQRG